MPKSRYILIIKNQETTNDSVPLFIGWSTSSKQEKDIHTNLGNLLFEASI